MSPLREHSGTLNPAPFKVPSQLDDVNITEIDEVDETENSVSGIKSTQQTAKNIAEKVIIAQPVSGARGDIDKLCLSFDSTDGRGQTIEQVAPSGIQELIMEGTTKSPRPMTGNHKA